MCLPGESSMRSYRSFMISVAFFVLLSTFTCSTCEATGGGKKTYTIPFILKIWSINMMDVSPDSGDTLSFELTTDDVVPPIASEFYSAEVSTPWALLTNSTNWEITGQLDPTYSLPDQLYLDAKLNLTGSELFVRMSTSTAENLATGSVPAWYEYSSERLIMRLVYTPGAPTYDSHCVLTLTFVDNT